MASGHALIGFVLEKIKVLGTGAGDAGRARRSQSVIQILKCHVSVILKKMILFGTNDFG
jgi:hypothetical protein